MVKTLEVASIDTVGDLVTKNSKNLQFQTRIYNGIISLANEKRFRV